MSRHRSAVPSCVDGNDFAGARSDAALPLSQEMEQTYADGKTFAAVPASRPVPATPETVESNCNPGILEAIRRVGSQAKLARMLGITQARVSQYLHGVRPPIRKALLIEQKLGVSVQLTRPDVFGNGEPDAPDF
jgi:Putative antitoxin of bacterial toxin-antitoxin system, YdaS/YdaT